MKEPRRMEIPRVVIMGSNVLRETPELLSELSFKNPLIVAGEQTSKIAKPIKKKIEEREYETEMVIINHANIKAVNKVLKSANRVDILLGVGGGKCIDVAKFASLQCRVPYISVPTSASHDGISSDRASIKGVGSSSIKAHSPLAIVADTQIIQDAPYRLMAAGCGDAIANYTAVWDWKLESKENGNYSEYSAALSKISAELVMKNSEIISEGTEESARKVVKALIGSGISMSIAGNSRPASGSEHLFSHALDRIVPNLALHGEQCGIGAIMMAKLQGQDWRKVRKTLQKVGCPTDAEDLGVQRRHIIEALCKACQIRPEQNTVLEDGLNEENAKRLAEETGVI